MAEFPNSTNTQTQSSVFWCNANKDNPLLSPGDVITFDHHNNACVKVTFPTTFSKILFNDEIPRKIEFSFFGDRCSFNGEILETGKTFICSIMIVNNMGTLMLSGQYSIGDGGLNDEQSGGWGGQ